MLRFSGLFVLATLAGCTLASGSDDEGVTHRDAITLPDGEDDAADDATDDAADAEEDAATPDTDPTVDADPPDTFVPPTDGGCTPTCTVCGGADGCGGKCATGSCSGGATCVAGTCVGATRSYLSPGDYAFGTAWARGITWTIGAESAATIRYTTDGSTPGPTSPSKPSPAEIFLATSGTTLKWYADNGAKEPVQSFTANIATSGQSSYGFILEKTNLGGKGPVIVVSPGATISGTTAYQAWVSSGCPACGLQLVYGIGTTSAGCIYHGSPNVWPGASGTGSLSVKAPSTAGTYTLNMTYTLQLSCADGMATNPLGVRPTAGIATIVVK